MDGSTEGKHEKEGKRGDRGGEREKGGKERRGGEDEEEYKDTHMSGPCGILATPRCVPV